MSKPQIIDAKALYFLADVMPALGGAPETLPAMGPQTLSERVIKLAVEVEAQAATQSNDNNERRLALFSTVLLRMADPLSGETDLHGALEEHGYQIDRKALPAIAHHTAAWLCERFVHTPKVAPKMAPVIGAVPRIPKVRKAAQVTAVQEPQLKPEIPAEPPRPVEEETTLAGPDLPTDEILIIAPDTEEDESLAEILPEAVQKRRSGSNFLPLASTDLNLLGVYNRQARQTPLLNADQEVELAKSIEAGLFAQERLDKAQAEGVTIPLKERRLLQVLAREGERDKKYFLEANLRLVLRPAAKYADIGFSLLDAIQEGNLGLIRAIEKFDYKKGIKFSTYAMWWIKQSIIRGKADQGLTIRIPVHVHDFLGSLRRTSKDLAQQLGRTPTNGEIAAEAKTTGEKVEEVSQYLRAHVSLDKEVSFDGGGIGTPFGDLLCDTYEESPVHMVARSEFWEMIEKRSVTQGFLSKREVCVFIQLHRERKSLNDVAELLGITITQVRRYETIARAKLAHPSFGLDLSLMS
jgi:RNA polymerase primary sigma factor